MADAIQAYVGSFTTPGAAVLTPQVVNGIVDRNGAQFRPKVLYFMPGGTGFVDDPGQPGQFIVNLTGFDDGTAAMCQCLDNQWGFDIPWNGFAGSTLYSIAACVAVFTGRFATRGKVTALASGQFTYTLDVNEFGSGHFTFLALGGSGLDYEIKGSAFVPGVNAVTGIGFTPKAGIFAPIVALTGNTTGNTWSKLWALGFVDAALNQGGSAVDIQDATSPLVAKRYQRTNRVGIGADAAAGLARDTLHVDSWDADGYTATFSAGGSPDWIALLLGGAALGSKFATLTQPTIDGAQTVALTNLLPAAALFASVGAPVSAILQDDHHFSMGVSDGTREAGLWTAALAGGTQLAVGGELWADDDRALLMATPVDDISSNSTPNGSLHVAGLSLNAMDLEWTDSDGVQREVLYFLIGLGITPVPPPSPGTTRYMRRVRRFPLPYDRNLWTYVRRIEFYIQSGVGLSAGQGENPLMEVRFSGDGGLTWGDILLVEMGQMGQYDWRPVLNNIGKFRNGWCEIADSDPVQSTLVDCYVDIDQSRS